MKGTKAVLDKKAVVTKDTVRDCRTDDWDVNVILGSNKNMRYMYETGKLYTAICVSDGEYITRCLGKEIRKPIPIINLFKYVLDKYGMFNKEFTGTNYIGIEDLGKGIYGLVMTVNDEITADVFGVEFKVDFDKAIVDKKNSFVKFLKDTSELEDLLYKAMYYSIELSSVPLQQMGYYTSRFIYSGESVGKGNSYYAGLCEATFENGVPGFDSKGEGVKGEYMLVFMEGI